MFIEFFFVRFVCFARLATNEVPQSGLKTLNIEIVNKCVFFCLMFALKRQPLIQSSFFIFNVILVIFSLRPFSIRAPLMRDTHNEWYELLSLYAVIIISQSQPVVRPVCLSIMIWIIEYPGKILLVGVDCASVMCHHRPKQISFVIQTGDEL